MVLDLAEDKEIFMDNSAIIKNINVFDCLYNQVTALLDIMQCMDEDNGADPKSISTVSEMIITMVDEMDSCTQAIFGESIKLSGHGSEGEGNNEQND